MNKKELKPTANIVGVAPLGDPHFEEHTPTSPTAYTNSKSKIKTLTSDNKGITLIALVITIIVMLILVAVTVTVAINGGLFTIAKQATTDTQYHADREMLLSAVIGAINKDAEVDFTKLDANLPNGFTGTQGEYTSKAGNTFYVDKNGNITDEKIGPSGPPQVTLGDQTITLTPDNVAEYLGKEVTNYAGKESVEINGKTYNVSTKYRLYYVDFENKYKDGEGTVYLKADCNGGEYTLETETTPEKDNIPENIKIKNLNPELYKNGTPPSSEYDNMKAVTWLTNTNNWSDLKPETFSDGITEQDIKYIVGAPSLELMIDSYNTHYGLTGKKPDYDTDVQEGERRKLFYKYIEGQSGYVVGPCLNELVEYYYFVDRVWSDSAIGSMYTSDDSRSYWLASPDGDWWDEMFVCFVTEQSIDGNCDSNEACSLCPLVSLSASVRLSLEN